ncbi:MAG: type II toxin-antitoxin system VapC family toxin [Alphaproteobacteria bacterium]|nr:type II toxin-antitoxin system VapC family toxin [Alphaproteobacteria bacterium]
MTYLLDTNVVSEVRRKLPDANVLAWFRRTDPAAIRLSVLTLGEIVKGAESLARRDPAAGQSLRNWLDGLRLHYADRLLGVDGAVAETWGRLSAQRPLPVIDGLLVATALVHNLILVTRNVCDVSGMGVTVVNPWNE